VLLLDGLFQPSLMFVDKGRSLPYSGTAERVGSNLTSKYDTMLERVAKEKHSNLLIDIRKLQL
jgi:hypothetical protein